MRFAQSRGLGLKVSDEFTVPLCAIHHNQIHTTGKEQEWWQQQNIDPLKVARALWQESPDRLTHHVHLLEIKRREVTGCGNPSVGPTPMGRLRQNEISQAAALKRAAIARELFDQIEARLPVASGKRIWHRINERWDLQALQHLVASGELDSDTLMAIVALDVYLTKYFRIIKAKLVTADGGLKTGTNEADTSAFGADPTLPTCDQDQRTE